MTADGFALFESAIGWIGIAWRGDVVAGAQLPEADEAGTRARMQRRFANVPETSPPPSMQHAIQSIQTLTRGEPASLGDVALDMQHVAPFDRKVYELARSIPPGTTLSYGDVAKRIGDPTAARAVGRSLGNNPFAPIVPCHRVVSADGTMHGFSAPGGVSAKLRLLTIEGYRANEPTLFG
jgi:methylated-DNA-[protein]-cysteine S-methyltransferase